MASKFLLGVLLVSVAICEIPEEDDVWVLDESNFQEALSTQNELLVEFYAPWCGHCKKLAPEYAQAAKTLKARNPPVRIAKVDATVSPQLASAHGVNGYPTLKYFINQKSEDYTGGRTADTIVSWIVKRTGPSVTVANTVDELKTLIAGSKVTVVLFAQESETNTIQPASKVIDGVTFILATTGATEYGVTEPTLKIFKQFDDKEQVYSGDLSDSQAVQKWIEGNKNRWVMPFDDAAIEYIFQKQNPCLFLFRADSESSNLDSALETLAKDYRQDIAFSYADISKEDMKRLGDYLGVVAKDMPTAVLIDHKGGLNKYKLDSKPTEESLRELYTQWKAGKLSPFLKSEPIPSDDFDGSVRVLVGKNFESVVYDSTKDVLVEFYAPWCGHCKSLAPEYEKLAATLKTNPNVIIAKVDSTANEVKGVNIQGFPTIKWFSKSNKAGVDYDGERNYSGLLNYVQNNSKDATAAPERTDL